MNTTKRRVFKFLSTERWNDSAIFFLRLFAGILMLTHGIAKIQNYNMLFDSFPDPIGLGSKASLIMIILTEVVGSVFIIVGFLVRPAALALAFGMFTASFLTIPGSSFSDHELSFLYMGIFIMLFISGGAKYSLDRFLFKVR